MGNASQIDDIREHPIHRCAVPLPQWGRLRNGDTAFLALSERIHAYVGKTIPMDKAFPNGEGCDTGMPLLSHRQNKYMHMWKKKTDGQSLPRVGKVASGASRIGF